MKFYLDSREVTLEEIQEVLKNLFHGEYDDEVLEVYKIEPNALYFTMTVL